MSLFKYIYNGIRRIFLPLTPKPMVNLVKLRRYQKFLIQQERFIIRMKRYRYSMARKYENTNILRCACECNRITKIIERLELDSRRRKLSLKRYIKNHTFCYIQ